MAIDLGTFYWPPEGGSGGGGDVPAHMKANQKAISSGTASVTVGFATAAGTAPVIIVSLSTSDGSPVLLSIIETVPTTAGFTVTLSSPTPTANYILNWIAASVYDS